MVKAVYEIMANALVLIGALLLCWSGYPYLNPEQFRLDHLNDGYLPLDHTLLFLPPALVILGAAWYFNLKARRLNSPERLDLERRKK